MMHSLPYINIPMIAIGLTPQHPQHTSPIVSSSDSPAAPIRHPHHPSQHTPASAQNHLWESPQLQHSVYTPTPYAAHENPHVYVQPPLPCAIAPTPHAVYLTLLSPDPAY